MDDQSQSLAEKYDSFQSPAVDAVVRDFSVSPSGRFLLVIPTGGGKTFTAVKAICALFDQEILSSDQDQVLWIAHRIELVEQAEEAFKRFCSISSTVASASNVKFEMVSQLVGSLANPKFKIVIIDEAHHSAAISYQAAFGKSDLGILGLTATPSRHDGLPLEFERESFSIGFPELVKKGIILRPQIITIDGESYDFDSFRDADLENLNNDIRNQKIVDAISANLEKFKKIIIFAGTRNHAESLWQLLVDSGLQSHYESISFVDGTSNSRGQIRKDFIEQEKHFQRSILVNVQVLTEGYDDPTVNTVFMVAPSQSKLYYMQAVGRAIRRDPNDLAKQAYVVEVSDDLPNIRYRIDNRWLFSDISDALEPAVRDVEYELNVNEALTKVFDEESVPERYRRWFEQAPDDRYSVLLFREYVSEGNYRSFPVLMNNETRPEVRNTFNFLSERMHKYRVGTDREQVFRMTGNHIIDQERQRTLVFDSMANAAALIEDEAGMPAWVVDGKPWVTFVSLNQSLRVSAEILAFCEEMVNRDSILELIRTKSYEVGCYVLRLPLPLGSYVGKIVTRAEATALQEILEELETLKHEQIHLDHTTQVSELLVRNVLPIEYAYANGLVAIVKESLEFLYELD